MSLYLRQQDTRSELQEKLAKELQERNKQKQKEFEQPDGVTDSAYLRDYKESGSLTWLWVTLLLIGVGLGVWLIIAAL